MRVFADSERLGLPSPRDCSRVHESWVFGSELNLRAVVDGEGNRRVQGLYRSLSIDEARDLAKALLKAADYAEVLDPPPVRFAHELDNK